MRARADGRFYVRDEPLGHLRRDVDGFVAPCGTRVDAAETAVLRHNLAVDAAVLFELATCAPGEGVILFVDETGIVRTKHGTAVGDGPALLTDGHYDFTDGGRAFRGWDGGPGTAIYFVRRNGHANR